MPDPRNLNPYASPDEVEGPIEPPKDRDDLLRQEYLGGVLLAAGAGSLAMVLMVVSRRHALSALGEASATLCGILAIVCAVLSLAFVAITVRAAAVRVWLLVNRIRTGRR